MSKGNYFRTRAGQLRDYVQFEARVDRFDGANAQMAPDWNRVGQAWADVQPVGGFRRVEDVHAQQLMAESSYTVVVRFRNDLTTKHRIRVLVGKPGLPEGFNILNIQDPDGRRRWLVMTCEAGLVDG